MLDLDYKVLKLLYRSEKPLKVGELSMDLDIPHSTTGSCVKRLEQEGYVIYKRYRPVTLSQKGVDLAIELIRHGQLMEILLYNELGLSIEKAHEEAEKFNLLLSCEIVNKICEKYGHPKKCPCGELILDSSSCYCENGHHES
ncbi:MAG: metal-dependent transcriptional regulator [Promethearchaeota archaeon]|nr:MAG: metal-dependent transcriptional regulator [Candidatus Lokiarchaeota archaeon]